VKKLKTKISRIVLPIRVIFILTFVVGFVMVLILTKNNASISVSEEVSTKTVLVKIPPIPNKNFTDAERFWQFQKFLYPQTEVPNPIPESIPNSCGLLYVSIESDGKLKINSEHNGSLENTEILRQRLQGIFRERSENGVYEEGSDKIVKAVLIKASLSLNYGDVFKIAEVVKESGAEPIVLQTDKLHY